MGNNIIKTLLDEKIEILRLSFQKTANDIFHSDENNKLFHSLEYGVYRENILKDFLRLITPSRLDFGQGFLLNCDSKSTQCDIVVYDRQNTPLLENSEKQRFFPVETVCGIFEVKSNLSKSQFKEALNKLAKNKIIRENIPNPSAIKKNIEHKFDPINNFFDNIFSVLICNKLDFNLDHIVYEIDSLYEPEIKTWQKHNLILSINDGLLAYYLDNDETMKYPYMGKQLKNRLVKPDVNKNIHFYYAASYIFMGLSSNNIYYPELTDYLRTYFFGGFNSDQK